jgi:hypothetical protein
MFGGNVALPRERFCMARTTEIATRVGQTIRFSGRGSMALCNEWEGGNIKPSNGIAIKEKKHAKIVTMANLSIIGAEYLVCRNSRECFEAFGILLASAPKLPMALMR